LKILLAWMLEMFAAFVAAFAENKSPVIRLKIICWTTTCIQRNLIFMKQDRPQKLRPTYLLS
jgi:hypothetical protein